jgi:aspartate beta-hydroxylase
MADIRLNRRWVDRSLFEGVWGLLRLDALRRGIDLDRLERVRAYLKHRYRLDRTHPADPRQRPRNFFPVLTARALHDPRQFSFVPPLEAAAESIREELRALLEQESFSRYRPDLALQGEWTTFMLWSFGLPHRANQARCPRTAAVLDSLSVDHGAGLTYFSALGPRTRVAAHCGPTNTRLRCHLGIVVPRGCAIRVGTTTTSWEEGRCIVFDDSFEHEVWNESDRSRYVLILDVWHPDLDPVEVWALARIERLSLLTSQRRRRKRALR